MTIRLFWVIVLCLGMLSGSADTVAATDLAPIRQLIERGKFTDAKDQLWEIIYKDDNDLEARTLLADCYRQLNRDEKAVELYQEVIERDPMHWEARLNMGLSFIKLRREPDAIAVYRTMVEESPDNAKAQYYLGIAYNSNKDMTYAFEQYKILKRIDPKLAKKLYDIIFLR